MKQNAQTIFYAGDGNVRWVSNMYNYSEQPVAGNYYGDAYPGDPYEVCVCISFRAKERRRDCVWFHVRGSIDAL